MLRPKLKEAEEPALRVGRKTDRMASRRAMRASPVSACRMRILVELDTAYAIQSCRVISWACAPSPSRAKVKNAKIFIRPHNNTHCAKHSNELIINIFSIIV